MELPEGTVSCVAADRRHGRRAAAPAGRRQPACALLLADWSYFKVGYLAAVDEAGGGFVATRPRCTPGPTAANWPACANLRAVDTANEHIAEGCLGWGSGYRLRLSSASGASRMPSVETLWRYSPCHTGHQAWCYS